jgi:hypothetical protein
MGKWANDAMMDAALDYVKGATELWVTTLLDATPTRTEVAAADLAGPLTMDGSDYAANSDGVTNGRKTIVAAQNGLSVHTTGSAENVALSDATNLRYVTSCTAQTLTGGNTVNVPAWNIEVADPA